MNYYYCYSIKKGLFDDEMAYAKDLGVYIFYDENVDAFFDKDGIPFDIKDKKIFPRTGVLQAKTLVDAIIKHGGYSLVTNEDFDKTTNWPYYIKTKRNNIILSGKQILENPQMIINIFGNDKVFFKTKHKNYSEIIKVSNFFEQESAFLKTIKEHEDEDFIISDAVSIEEDEYGLIEYRAFIVNNEIINISRVSGYLLGFIPKEVLDKSNDIINNLKKTDFPKSYVLDLFIYNNEKNKKVVDVLECNPIISSGLYLYNSVFEKQQDLLHKCPSISIPKEKLKSSKSKYYGFNVKETRRPSITYNMPGGFSADLTSFTFFGTKASKGAFFHFSTGNINLLGLDEASKEKATPIENDLDIGLTSEEIKHKILKKK